MLVVPISKGVFYMAEKKEGTEATNGKGKGVRTAVLSGFFLVVIFIFAFGCYACSYQPAVRVPDEDEAAFTLDILKGSEWVLDTAAGETSLPELKNMVIEGLAFMDTLEDDKVQVLLERKGLQPVLAYLSYSETDGFVLDVAGNVPPIKVIYSQSNDGVHETIVFRGLESSIQCYFLRK